VEDVICKLNDQLETLDLIYALYVLIFNVHQTCPSLLKFHNVLVSYREFKDNSKKVQVIELPPPPSQRMSCRYSVEPAGRMHGKLNLNHFISKIREQRFLFFKLLRSAGLVAAFMVVPKPEEPIFLYIVDSTCAYYGLSH
jgi:hypothetical protein